MASGHKRTADGWEPIVPKKGESLDGFVFRFAGENMIGSTAELLGENSHYVSVRSSARGGDGKLARLSRSLGVPVADVAERAYLPVDGVEATRGFFGTTIHRTDLDRRHRLFAPAALARSPHHRAMWQVRAFPFCTETWQYLRETCHRCGQRQKWAMSLGVARCDKCVKDLSAAPADEVDPVLRYRLRLAAGIVSPDPATRAASLAALPPAVAALGSSGAFELLARLVPVTDPALPHGRDADVWKVPAPRLARAMAEAWDLAAGWPHAFVEHASARIGAAAKRYQDGNGGATVRFLRLATDEFVPPPVAALVAELRASLDLDDEAGAAHASRTLDCMSASYLLGRGTPVVARYRRAGTLRAIFAHRGGMPIAMLDRAEIEGIRADMADRSTVEAVSWRLGVPNYGVEQLVELGVLATLDHPWFHARYDGPQVRTSSVDALEAGLGAGPPTPVGGDPVPLTQALHAVGGRLKPWGPLLKALVEGAPFAIASDDGTLARRLMVGADQIDWLRGMRTDADDKYVRPSAATITKKDAGDVLNLAPRQLHRVFPSERGPVRQRRAAMPMESVLALAADHATHGELAMRSGLSVRRVAAVMRRLGHAAPGPLGFEREAAEAAMPALAEAATAQAAAPGGQRDLFEAMGSSPPRRLGHIAAGDAPNVASAVRPPLAGSGRVSVADVARLSGLTEKQASVAMRAARGGRALPPSGYERGDVERAMPALLAEAAERARRCGWRDLAHRGGLPLSVVRTAVKRLGCDLSDPLGIPSEAAPAVLAEAARLAGARAVGSAAAIERRRGVDGRVGA